MSIQKPIHRRGIALAALVAILAATCGSSTLADARFRDRPAFSAGDQEPERPATCPELRAMASGLVRTDERIDLAVTGRLTFVHTDGALWYLVMCAAPDIRVMCVTYSDNGMRVGDVVTFGGGYTRLNEHQVVLDPCLAAPAAGR